MLIIKKEDKRLKMEDINCYYIYILRCMDESLYTGIAKNVERRFEEHKSKGKNVLNIQELMMQKK